MSGGEHGGEPRMSRDELRLRLYELLQRKVERERTSRLVRLGGGVTVVGVLLAYAIAAGNLRVVSVTPILYGVAAMAGLKSTVDILYLHRHMVRIERELGDHEPLFRWVTRYGVFGRGQALTLADVNLNDIPNVALLALFLSVYFVLVIAGLRTWPGSPGATTVPVTRGLLAFGYAVFTAVVLAIAGVGYLHFRRLGREIERERAG